MLLFKIVNFTPFLLDKVTKPEDTDGVVFVR